MDNHYRHLKHFIKDLEKKYGFYRYIGRRILKDIKYNRIVRCSCRKFNHKTLDINFQCPNPVSTITNMCFHCDKYADYIGYVNQYPVPHIIDQYEQFGKHHNIVFKKKFIRIGKYKKYISNTDLKIKIKDIDNYAQIEVFKIVDIGHPNKGILIDKYSNHIGTYSFWVDRTNVISSKYKNDEDQVLDPNNYIPLMEYNLEKKNMYHNLSNRIYRRYTYDSIKDAMTLTHNIIDI